MSCDHGLNQRVSPPGRAGAWQVRADRALSLRPGRAAVLSIRQGGAWVTLPQADDRFSREVSQPAQEVVQSLARAGLALLRLIRGVLGYADYLVANRGRVPGPLESMRS